MKDKVIVVTGASGALGSVVARTLAGKGALVAAVDLAPIPADDSLATRLDGIDLTDENATRQAFATIAERLGGIDGLANVAGGFVWEGIEHGTAATWDRLYTLNLRTALLSCQAVIPFVKASRGAIVNVRANAAGRAARGMGAYAASKSGVARLTEALSEELKDDYVRVNAVLPSILDTALNRQDMPDADFDRWVTPEALAEVIAFLLGTSSSAITGAAIPVSGRV